MKFNFKFDELPEAVQNALRGVFWAWGFTCGLLGGLLLVGLIGALCITHPLIGLPVLITALGALGGWLNDGEDDY